MPYVTGNAKRFEEVYESFRHGKKNVELTMLSGVPTVFVSFASRPGAQDFLDQELKPLFSSESEFETSIIGPLAGNYFVVIVGPSL